ncbi:hypothetical protein [Aeromicrobium sp. UC242_57]|uniref:hypothetical protein n=1 Tax=Aeromicrobium sp. UC242_57 TaxID=3374624 RepID=UPI0037B17F79
MGRTGLVMRAISLVDIALWDIQAKRAGLPLHRLLGGMRDEVPAIFVAGYPSILDDVDETVAAVTSAGEQGLEPSRSLAALIRRSPRGCWPRSIGCCPSGPG